MRLHPGTCCTGEHLRDLEHSPCSLCSSPEEALNKPELSDPSSPLHLGFHVGCSSGVAFALRSVERRTASGSYPTRTPS